MQRITEIPLLSRQDEVDLATVAEAGRQAADDLEKQFVRYGSLAQIPWTPARLEEVRRRIVAGHQATVRLVFHNLRFAAWAARHSMGWNQTSEAEFIREAGVSNGGRKMILELSRFARDTLPLEDRFHVLVESMLDSATNFLPNSRCAFTSYASYGMARALARAITLDRFRSELSAHQAEGVVRVRAARRKLRRLTGFEPGLAELKDDTSLGWKEVAFRLEEDAMLPYFSLEDLAARTRRIDGASRERLELADILSDETTPDPAEQTWLMARDADIEAILRTLSEREADAIRLRFGLANGNVATLDEIGAVYGVTRERARKIVSHAISKLREENRRQRLRPYAEE